MTSRTCAARTSRSASIMRNRAEVFGSIGVGRTAIRAGVKSASALARSASPRRSITVAMPKRASCAIPSGVTPAGLAER